MVRSMLPLPNNPPPIKRHDVFISGFMQEWGNPCGLAKAWRNGLFLASQERDDRMVWLRTWNAKMDDLANMILLHAPLDHVFLDIRIYCYSWGGQTAINLCNELCRRSADVRIEYMVMCDAVYRHFYLAGQWRAAIGWPKLHIPANVREVHWFRQQNPRWAWGRYRRGINIFQPAGHDIKADDPTQTIIFPAVVLNTEHSWMDDEPAFQQKCWEIAQLPHRSETYHDNDG